MAHANEEQGNRLFASPDMIGLLMGLSHLNSVSRIIKTTKSSIVQLKLDAQDQDLVSYSVHKCLWLNRAEITKRSVVLCEVVQGNQLLACVAGNFLVMLDHGGVEAEFL